MSDITIQINPKDASLVIDYHDGKTLPGVALNKHLITKQKSTDADVVTLLLSHTVRNQIFSVMRNTTDVETLQRYDRAYQHLQRCQQELWGFEQNDNFLRPWDVPKCECPKMDNDDMYGTPHRITSGACKIHWKTPEAGKNET